jgi:hypothetical protein
MQYKLPDRFRSDYNYWGSYKNKPDTELIPTKIISIKKIPPKTKGFKYQYDLSIKDNHNYFADRLLVHNSNVSILLEGGTVTHIFNRTTRVPFINKDKHFIIEGLLNSAKRGYLEFLPDGQHFGELIGPKVQGNPYNLKEHLWIPFTNYTNKFLTYTSWGKYPKDFKSIESWLKTLMPLYSLHINGDKNGFVEGIIFRHPDGRRAKLRKDMYSWFSGLRHKEE